MEPKNIDYHTFKKSDCVMLYANSDDPYNNLIAQIVDIQQNVFHLLVFTESDNLVNIELTITNQNTMQPNPHNIQYFDILKTQQHTMSVKDDFEIEEDVYYTDTYQQKNYWDLESNIEEQKKDLFDTLISEVPIEKVAFMQEKIQHKVEQYFSLIEDYQNSSQHFITKSQKYSTINNYLQHSFDLPWLLPVSSYKLDTTYTSDVSNTIKQTLYSYLQKNSNKNRPKTEKLFFNKNYSTNDTINDFIGDSEYENILYNGKKKTNITIQ